MRPVRPTRRLPVLTWVSVALLGSLAVAVVVVSGLVVAAVPAGAVGLSVRVVGAGLVDGSGAGVSLRGVNVSGTEFACIQGGSASSRGWSIYGGQPLDVPATFAAVAGWRANVVRVPLNEDCWLGINGVNPAFGGVAYRAAIAAEVSAIHAAGLVAILDLHWTSPGGYAAYNQQSMADADHSVTFWSQVAAAYRDDPAVVFDLFNEPFFYYIADGSDQWTCWLRGCQQNAVLTAGQPTAGGGTAPYQVSYSWRSAGMQQLVDAVRAAGARQPIIVNGVDWANDLSGFLTHRPVDPQGQLVAGWHSYPGQPCSPQSCWDQVIAPIAGQLPVLVGETGDSAAGAPSYLPGFLPWADSHHVSYLAWTWNPWANSDNVLIKDWNGTPTNGEGTYYRNHLLSLPDNGGGGDTVAPVVTGRSPSPGATAVPATSAVRVTFSEPVQRASVVAALRTSAGAAVATTMSWDANSAAVTLTPTAALAVGVQYTASVSGAQDAAGNVMAGVVTWSFTTGTSTNGCPCSLWPASRTPATTDSDTAAVELGVKVTAKRSGSVSAVRFYKAPENTGPHTVHVWSVTGALLATATATDETASGWQTVQLPSPVAMSPGSTYVVSYHAPQGRYSVNNGYFGSARKSEPLTAPSSVAAGGNGVYHYGPSGSFPTDSFQSSNYWVDLLFS